MGDPFAPPTAQPRCRPMGLPCRAHSRPCHAFPRAPLGLPSRHHRWDHGQVPMLAQFWTSSTTAPLACGGLSLLGLLGHPARLAPVAPLERRPNRLPGRGVSSPSTKDRLHDVPARLEAPPGGLRMGWTCGHLGPITTPGLLLTPAWALSAVDRPPPVPARRYSWSSR